MITKTVPLGFAPTLRYNGDTVKQFAHCAVEGASFPRKYHFAEGSNADIQQKKRSDI